MFIRNLPSGGGGGVTPGGGSSGFTQGSVIFADAAGALNQDNAAFFWDSTNDRLGIGTNAPLAIFDLTGSISPAANANGRLARIAGTIVEAGSGTHARLMGLEISVPTITGGAATVTETSTLYVAGQPTGGTFNHAAVIDGSLKVGGTVDGQIFVARSNGTRVLGLSLAAANYLDIGSLTATSNGTRIYGAGGNVSIPSNNLLVGGEVEIDGAFNHDGTTFGALGAAPATQAAKINDPAGGATVDAESRTAINALIDVFERFGFSSTV